MAQALGFEEFELRPELMQALEKMGLAEVKIQKILADQKWELILEFMEEHGYEETFRNEKFVIFE